MVEIVDDVAAFARLEGEWNRLLQASSADCLFLTWEWLFTWWQHLAGDRRLFILTVRSGGELIAIAPFAQSAPHAAGLFRLPSAEFLGTGIVGSDYLDILARRGAEEEALASLATFLSSQRLVLEFAQLNAHRSSAATLADSLTGRGWSRLKRPSGVCPFIRLEGHTWESYLATLGSEHRYNFRRRLKRATSAFEFSFEQARSPEECRIALDQTIALHNLRWRGQGGSDAFRTAAIERFHHAISLLALDRGWLRLFVLRFDGVPVAALYGFFYNGVFSFYQSGYDPSYGKHSVGLLAMGLSIKSAIEEGAGEYDMLHGDESYKFHWAKEMRALEDVELFAPSTRALLARQARVVQRRVSSTARQVLPRSVAARISAARRLGVWEGLYGAWVT